MKHLRGAAGIILSLYLCRVLHVLSRICGFPACTRAWMSAAGRAILISGCPGCRYPGGLSTDRCGIGICDPYFQTNYEKALMQA